MRTIKYIVVHSSATSQQTSLDDIQRYWRVEKHKHNPIYHYVIKTNGDAIQLATHEKLTGVTVGHNAVSIHVCYIGGVDKEGYPTDNRTKAQEDGMFDLLVALSVKFPKASIVGYRDLPGIASDSPCFDVRTWLKSYVPSYTPIQE